VKDIVVPSEIKAALRESGFRNVDDFAEQINDYVKSNDILCRTKLRHYFEKLVDEPVLKNQFETVTSNIKVNLGNRRKWERVLSDWNSDNMMDRERPIYGYVGEVKRPVGEVGKYGDTTVVFKESVRDRATFTIGNSSWQQGAFTDDVRAIFNDDRKIQHDVRLAGNAANIAKDGKDGYVSRWYLESQIWGCADLRQDVKEIAIGETDLKYLVNNVKLERWQQFKTQMDEVGVKLVYYTDKSDEFIQKNPATWKKLKKNANKLGLVFIRIER